MGVFTFSASSGTVSSPFTTVNRLVCKKGRLRKIKGSDTQTHIQHPQTGHINRVFSAAEKITTSLCTVTINIPGRWKWSIWEAESERISYPNLSLSSSLRVMYICSWIRTSFTNVCKTSTKPVITWSSVSQNIQDWKCNFCPLRVRVAVSSLTNPLFSLYL